MAVPNYLVSKGGAISQLRTLQNALAAGSRRKVEIIGPGVKLSGQEGLQAAIAAIHCENLGRFILKDSANGDQDIIVNFYATYYKQ